MDISQKHQNSKVADYWDELVSGTTSQYKEKAIDQLISKFINIKINRLLDIGCGTCDLILKYQKKLDAPTAVCMDYDKKIIEQMKKDNLNENIGWKVGDIFEITSWKERFDLVFLLDMIHEIYSFYGRPDRDINHPINHTLGQKFAAKALSNVATLVNPGGGIIITDNVICEENCPVTLKCNTKDSKEALDYFFEHYLTWAYDISFQANNTLEINSRDLCILLTQYNKIKNKDWERWNVERLEVHQYMTLQEYEQLFSSLGFSCKHIIGTPKVVTEEWRQDFTIIDGLQDFPQKRINLLAIRNQ